MIDSIRQTPLDTTVNHHQHNHHQIVIGLTGYAEFEIAQQSGIIAPLTGCLVPANVEHYYQGLGENRQLIIDLDDEAESLTGAHRPLRRLFDRPGYFSLDDTLTHYLQFLVQESTRPHHTPNGLLVATLLSALQTRIDTRQPQDMRSPRRIRALDIARLERYVQAHLHRRIQVADLARLVCLSEAHFSARFREQTGLTPYQFVLRQRLSTARGLIVANELDLAGVAERAGFASQSALSHAFRRHYGHPPIALRESLR
ncbi:helix-turn-helix domain-containing protein [Salinicola aestuarinus]|uniref:helix-turn-helix domain-containing protein n=1 Tax=Salinicola aestuarinus TaxID=1949082 RepID=UPI000DA1D9E3|nr:AraC family transcriptional regulator [Salinicola aestuarinus]